MILTIDQGTTSSRALVISAKGEIVSLAQKEFKQIYPQSGWVEHDPMEIWNSTLEVCRDALSNALNNDNESGKKISKDDLKGIAITNQRETTILWDKRTGKPVYNAIVWQCRRTANYCAHLRAETNLGKSMHEGFSEHVRKSTGLIIDSYFSGPKISWILDKENHINFQDGKVKAETDSKYWDSINDIGIENILFGTVDTWILWNLTEGQSHYTEASNASRTMLYEIAKGTWDKKILETLKIPESILPKVISSNGDFGSTPLFKDLLDKELPIKAMLGDQQAAWHAHHEAPKITYGTGAFVLLPAESGDKMISAPTVDGLLTSVGFAKDKTSYVYEGSIFIAGAIVQWLRDGLKIIEKSSDIEALAKTVDDNGGVYLVPALAGLGAPHWREDVRGTIFGLSRASTQGHIARAALEGIAFSVKDVFNKLQAEKTNLKIKHVNVDGGASKNDLLMQFQADLLGIEVHRMQEAEMTALGAARMTGDVDFKFKAEKIFKPQNDLNNEYSQWSKYIDLLLA